MLYIVDDDKCQLFPQKIESSGYVNQAKDAWVERDEKKKKEKRSSRVIQYYLHQTHCCYTAESFPVDVKLANLPTILAHDT